MAAAKKEEFWIRSRYRKWKLWQVALPLGVILLVGIPANLIAGVDLPVVRVLGGCDLLLFVAMLLLGVAVHLEEKQLELSSAVLDDALDERLGWAKLAGILLLLFFAVVRADIAGGALVAAGKVSDRGLLYVATNIVTLLAGVAFARYAYLRMIELEVEIAKSR